MLSKYTNGGTTVTLQNFLDVIECLGGFNAMVSEGSGFACFGGDWVVDLDEEDCTHYDYTITVEGEIIEKISSDKGGCVTTYNGLSSEDVYTLSKMFDVDKDYVFYQDKLYYLQYDTDVVGTPDVFIMVDGKKVYLNK